MKNKFYLTQKRNTKVISKIQKLLALAAVSIVLLNCSLADKPILAGCFKTSDSSDLSNQGIGVEVKPLADNKIFEGTEDDYFIKSHNEKFTRSHNTVYNGVKLNSKF